ncbi:hypothetical protein MRX96_043122 [Rhipicephalus microplus]
MKRRVTPTKSGTHHQKGLRCLPDEAREKTLGHCPRLTDASNAAQGRLEECKKKTKFFCAKCHLLFCITKDRRCFENARTK